MIPLLFVLSVVVPATVQSASCPPLQFPTVLAECQFEGRPLDCARRPSPPGTRATSPHVVRAGYMRLSSYEVLCGPRGEWGDGPFRCVPTQPPEPSVGAAPAPASCPPLRSRTVLAECRLAGQPVDCMSRPALPGTVAKFRCRPLHEFLFGYLPAAGFESRCSSAGDWSVQPFRCVPICGQPTGRGVEFIRNGNMSTSAADFPWHVTVYDKATPKNVKQICGGTLISTKYFVSAAHCFHNGKTAFPASRYVAGFGKVKRSANDTEPTEQFRETSKIFTNGYKGARELHSNDIALVELKEDVDITSWTMPVCVDWGLELPDLQHGEKGAVVGFGGERPTKELHFALLPFAKSDECRKNVSDVLAVFNKLKDKFCIGFVNRTQVSKGDSGGGIAFPSTDRVWFLRGVVSIGDSARTTYSFFTNVTHYVPWMAGIIQRGEVTGRRCGIGGSQSEGSEIHDFPWDVDVFYKQTSSRHPERLQTGALIRPNLAITQSRTVSSTGQPVDLSEYPAAWLWVTPSRNITSIPNPEMTGNVSEVVRVFFPGDVLAASGRLYNLVLLELRQPLQLMPVCLDWTGTTLLQGQHGTGIVDIGQAGRKRWTSLSLLDAARCKQSIAPESHHVCAFHEGSQQVRPRSSLYVFADSTWFLRGAGPQSADWVNGTVSAFTDMADPGVHQWLAKTRDMIGKPTCGNLNLCESLSAGLSLRGHLPWSVAVIVDTGAAGRARIAQSAGTLIHSHVVLTDSALLFNTTGWDHTGQLPLFPADNISIRWTSVDGSVRKSQVTRVSVRGQSLVTGRPDIALLELRDAVTNTPVCLDLGGHVLQQMAVGQLGLVEAWTTWDPSKHNLVSVPYMGPTECSAQLRQSATRSREPNEFCTWAAPGVLGPTVRGGGYLMSSGSQWFIQGLYNGYARFRDRTLVLASDFRDDSLKSWLREELKTITVGHSQQPEESGPRNCVGGRPTSASECGVFRSQDETQGEDDYIFKPSRNHMEWNVQVHLNRGEPLWEVRAGVLVRPAMVLTTALDLFTDAETGETISASDVIVKYLSADSRGPFSVEVERISIRERCPGCGGPAKRYWVMRELHYDLALLQLKTAVTLMPVCLPNVGYVAAPLNGQTEGLVEVWEDAYSTQRSLRPILFKMIGICVLAEYTRVPGVLSTMPSADFLNNEFCAADSSAEGTALGAAYSVISAEGKWVVRGLRAMDWVSSNNGTVRVFYNLDTPPIREWLDDKAQVGTANETTADASNVAELSPNKPPTPPSPCGETKLPLFRLLSDSETLAGPLPWSVAIQVDGKEQLNSGVLVRRDIVLTDASLLTTPQFVANDTGTVHTVNPDQVRVVWVSSSGRRRMAEVLAVHAHEREYGPLDQVGATPAFDVALLRLKTPFTDSEVAVACLDQEKLPKLERYQVGLTDAWEISLLGFQSNVQGSMHVDVMGMYCAFKNSAFTTDVMTPSAFCTGPMKEQVRSGAGFLVRKGGSWFVNGIVSYHITNFVSYESKNSWVVTNLDEEGVKDWIHQKLEAEAPDTTPRRTQASEPIECGQTTLALSSLAENETLARSMPWSAIIYGRGLNGSVTSMVPGVLVRPDMVLTGNENATYIMDPSHTFVVWIRPNGRKQRSSVRSVHPHGRPRGSPGFDLVLLRLKEPFLDTSVACVDIETPSAELDRKGVMEPWSFLPNPKERLCKEKHCSKVPAAGVLAPHVLGVPFGPECSSCEESCAQGVFCVRGTLNRPRVRANGSEMELKIHPGAGFLVKRANAWYLRGIVAFYWPSKENLLAVTDLTTAGVREWLRAGLALSSSKDPPLKPAALNAKE